MLDNRFQYFTLRDNLAKMETKERNECLRRLAKEDLFFLCWFIFGWSFYNPNIKMEDYKYKLDKEFKPTTIENTPEEQEELYQHALLTGTAKSNISYLALHSREKWVTVIFDLDEMRIIDTIDIEPSAYMFAQKIKRKKKTETNEKK